jgi:hypothetical protein
MDANDADSYLVYDEHTAKEINQTYRTQNKTAAAVGIGSARLEKVYSQQRKNDKTRLAKRRRVMYVLGLMYGNANRNSWTDIQTFQLQQNIVRTFKKFPDIDFIVKGLAISDLDYNPLPEFIRDLNLTNCIYLTSGKFVKMLGRADIFLFDFYSTAMAEALMTNKTIILYYDKKRPLPLGMDSLAKRIHLVENIDELSLVLEKIVKNGDDFPNNNEYQKNYLIPRFGSGGAAKAAVDIIFEKIENGD